MYIEEQILEQLRQKDRTAFEVLFKTHYEALVGFVNKYLGNKAEAEELVQDLFFHFWQKIKDIKIESSLKAYLYQAARNRALNVIKHRSVERKYSEHFSNNHDAFENNNSLEIDELQEKIQIAIDILPEKCRQVFMLSRFEEKKYKEIAEELGISIKTVENQMGKALRVMREELGEYLPILVFMAMELMKSKS